MRRKSLSQHKFYYRLYLTLIEGKIVQNYATKSGKLNKCMEKKESASSKNAVQHFKIRNYTHSR
jgi:hypothetical protein